MGRRKKSAGWRLSAPIDFGTPGLADEIDRIKSVVSRVDATGFVRWTRTDPASFLFEEALRWLGYKLWDSTTLNPAQRVLWYTWHGECYLSTFEELTPEEYQTIDAILRNLTCRQLDRVLNYCQERQKEAGNAPA